jgi:hypothetical protein
MIKRAQSLFPSNVNRTRAEHIQEGSFIAVVVDAVVAAAGVITGFEVRALAGN